MKRCIHRSFMTLCCQKVYAVALCVYVFAEIYTRKKGAMAGSYSSFDTNHTVLRANERDVKPFRTFDTILIWWINGGGNILDAEQNACTFIAPKRTFWMINRVMCEQWATNVNVEDFIVDREKCLEWWQVVKMMSSMGLWQTNLFLFIVLV